jgi:hypothetical protein
MNKNMGSVLYVVCVCAVSLIGGLAITTFPHLALSVLGGAVFGGIVMLLPIQTSAEQQAMGRQVISWRLLGAMWLLATSIGTVVIYHK